MKGILNLIAEFPLEKVEFPPDKVAEGEIVVGILENELKRFWGFLREQAQKADSEVERLTTELHQLENDFRAQHTPETRSTHDHSQCPAQRQLIKTKVEEIKATREKFEKLSETFWNLVDLEFGQSDDVSLEIREGGQIVTIKNDESEENKEQQDSGSRSNILGHSGGVIHVIVLERSQPKPGILQRMHGVIFGGR